MAILTNGRVKCMPAPKTFCDDVGGVGADRDHFAVGHVDDAHQAEGDGQAERHHEQNAAGAETAKERAEEIHDGSCDGRSPRGPRCAAATTAGLAASSALSRVALIRS